MSTKVDNNYRVGNGESQVRLVPSGQEQARLESGYSLKNYENVDLGVQKSGIRLEQPKKSLFNVGTLRTASYGEHRINLWSAAKCLQRLNGGKGFKIGYYFKLLFSSESSRKKYVERQFSKITPSRFSVVKNPSRASFLLPHSKSDLFKNSPLEAESHGLLLVDPSRTTRQNLPVVFRSGYSAHLQMGKTEHEKKHPVWKSPASLQNEPSQLDQNEPSAHSLHGHIECLHHDYNAQDPTNSRNEGLNFVFKNIFDELSPRERASLLQQARLLGADSSIRVFNRPGDQLVPITLNGQTKYVDSSVVTREYCQKLQNSPSIRQMQTVGEKNAALDFELTHLALRLSPSGLGNFLENTSSKLEERRASIDSTAARQSTSSPAPSVSDRANQVATVALGVTGAAIAVAGLPFLGATIALGAAAKAGYNYFTRT